MEFKKVIKLIKNILLIIVGLAVLLVWGVLQIFEPYGSEDDYKAKVLEELTTKFNEEFVIVGQKELAGKSRSRHTYPLMLVVSPKENPGLTFYAKLEKTHGRPEFRGSDSTYAHLETDYVFKSFLHYLPDMYKKHLGININEKELNRDYEDYVGRYNWMRVNLPRHLEFYSNPHLLAIDVNRENAREKAKKIASIFRDYLTKAPFNRFEKMYKENGEDITHDIFDLEIPLTINGKQYEYNQLANTVSIWELFRNSRNSDEQQVYNKIMHHIRNN